MKVYVFIQEDRHYDTEVEVYLSKSEAITKAKEEVLKASRGEEVDENLNRAMIGAGWCYNVIYSCEGDAVRVVEKEIQGFPQ
jgi:hypothetical protein